MFCKYVINREIKFGIFAKEFIPGNTYLSMGNWNEKLAEYNLKEEGDSYYVYVCKNGCNFCVDGGDEAKFEDNGIFKNRLCRLVNDTAQFFQLHSAVDNGDGNVRLYLMAKVDIPANDADFEQNPSLNKTQKLINEEKNNAEDAFTK